MLCVLRRRQSWKTLDCDKISSDAVAAVQEVKLKNLGVWTRQGLTAYPDMLAHAAEDPKLRDLQAAWCMATSK